MTSLWIDVRFALRMMWKTPGMTAVLVVTLAVGIGASTAIFSVVSSVLLRPLAYDAPERLARVYTGGKDFRDFPLSPPEYQDLARACRSCAGTAAWVRATTSLAGGDRPVRVTATYATASLLPLLGVPPLLGRFYDANEDRPGDPSVVILGYDLWQRAFGGDPKIVGKKILSDAMPVTVIGVMPKGFDFIDRSEAWLPSNLNYASERRDIHNWHVLVRLADGASVETLQSEIVALTAAWSAGKGPAQHAISSEHPMFAVAFQADLVGSMAKGLWLLQAAVLFVLLIAIVNVANLLLARANTRNREVAIRHAVGASRRRLLRQFATESLVLALVGGGLGLLVAVWAVAGVAALIPRSAPRASEITLDTWSVLFAIGCSIVASMLFGLAPILHARKTDLHGALKEGSRMAGSKRRLRARRALVIAEIGLAVLLVVGCTVMIRSFLRLQQTPLGFSPDRVLTFGLELPDKTYPGETANVFWQRLETRLRAMPGVASAGLVTGLPPSRLYNNARMQIVGRTPPPDGAFHANFRQFVGEGAIETLGGRIVQGRAIDASDTVTSPLVVLVNEAFVREFFPTGNAVGQRLRAFDEGPEQTIVGVVADMKQGGVDKPAGTEVFLPLAQFPAQFPNRPAVHTVWVIVRTLGDPRASEPAIAQAVADLDVNLALFQVRTMDDVMWEAISRPRFLTFLLTCFAGIALLLAAVGIYGVMAQSVAERTPEIGLRLALGARPSQVRGMIVRQAATFVGFGIATGIVGTVLLQAALGSSLHGLFYGARMTEPGFLAIVSVAVAVMALLATWIPVRRVTRVMPSEVLKNE